MTEQNFHTETIQSHAAENTTKTSDNSAATTEDTPATEDTAQTADTPEARVTALEANLAEMKDRWMRAEAEIQNLQARAKRDVEEAHQYAVQKFARDVVEAAENLQRGIASLPPTKEDEDGLIVKLREGFESTERSFLAILERHGITRHDPTGTTFDADRHQAMQEQDSTDHTPGHIIQAWTPTWLLKERLLKPAMVVVASSASTGKKPE